MAVLLQDLRYALRTLRKSPLFATVAVLSLALGIGANTAIFTLINQLILQLLPVKHPEELVLLTWRGSHYGNNTGSNAISYPLYQDFRDKNQVFRAMFCRYGMTMSLSVGGRTELVAGELVSGNYFLVLGVGAALGRVFTASDDLYQGGHPLAVLSYGFWKTRFGGDRGILGQRIVVNGYPLTIVGVSPAGFDGVEVGYAPQILVPMMMKKEMTPGPWYGLNDRRSRFVQAFGRLKPGMTLAAAKAGIQPLFHQILAMEVQDQAFAHASQNTKEQFLKAWMDVLPASKGRSDLRRQFSNPLWALMAMVGLVLLIACSNVANLLIARATARQKEVAVRLAMGASRGRLICQLLEESLLLSIAGGAAGLGLAVSMDKALVGFLPSGVIPLDVSSTPDARVLGFTLAISRADRPDLRAGSRAAIDAAGTGGDSEGPGRRGGGRNVRGFAQDARGAAGGALALAVDRSGPVHPEPEKSEGPESWVPDGKPGDVLARSHAERLQAATQPAVLPAVWWNG